MTDKQWDTLFALIRMAVDLPGMSADEKGETIRAKANERDELTNLEEFCAQVSDD